MGHQQFNQALCCFLDKSPTPFHAVLSLCSQLDQHGFTRLDEMDSWGTLSPGNYYVTRNESSIIAFVLPELELADAGFHMACAHTDSPCLKIKPQPLKDSQHLLQLGVEVYGSALLNPWFDRDLSMAGRVTYIDNRREIKSTLIDIKKAIATIPSLAIHLDRDANKNRAINPQLHLSPIVMSIDHADRHHFADILKQYVISQYPTCTIDNVLGFEMSLYDSQPAALIGINDDFISSGRLDNLLSCYVAIEALIAAGNHRPNLVICSDHEEVGSVSTAGAQGSFLQSVLSRLCLDTERKQRMLQRSVMVSADNAHAVHPNYADRHDDGHGPKLNAGPVIKTNANQRYATNSETGAFFRQLCIDSHVPVQDFVMRNDMGCGSTIGPIIASNLGIKTVDVGVPTYAMHSIRELAGSHDSVMLYQVLTRFFSQSTIKEDI